MHETDKMVNIYICITARIFALNLFEWESKRKFTPKGVAAQLPPLFMLTYAYFYIVMAVICHRSFLFRKAYFQRHAAAQIIIEVLRSVNLWCQN